MKVAAAIANVLIARPSNPSVRLTPLAVLIKTRAANKMYSNPKSGTKFLKNGYVLKLFGNEKYSVFFVES